jgi:hypothetical protein
MVTITFPDRETEKRALAFLLDRFSGRVLRSGEHLVPEAALEALADQNIPFTVKGKTTYEQQWRRFEVLPPLRYNDGRAVPPEWLAEAVLEIVDHFGAASYETQKVEGHWRHGGVLYRDDLVRVVVDVPDVPVHRRWMKEFKERWRIRLEQIELWMVSFRINVE